MIDAKTPQSVHIETPLDECRKSIQYHLEQVDRFRAAGNEERAASHARSVTHLCEQETVLKMKETPRWESLPEEYRFAYYAQPCDETASLAYMAAYSSLVGVGFAWPSCISVSVIEDDGKPYAHWQYMGRGVPQGEAYIRVWHSMYTYLIANGWMYQSGYDPRGGVSFGWYHSLNGWVELEDAIVKTVERSLAEPKN